MTCKKRLKRCEWRVTTPLLSAPLPLVDKGTLNEQKNGKNAPQIRLLQMQKLFLPYLRKYDVR